jgi:hypothetical protein
MTFDDDFIRLLLDGGNKDIPCKANGYEFPPPEEITLMGFTFKRTRYSQVSDKDRKKMKRVMRGAEYKVVK